jgi:hypothetical protein
MRPFLCCYKNMAPLAPVRIGLQQVGAAIGSILGPIERLPLFRVYAREAHPGLLRRGNHAAFFTLNLRRNQPKGSKFV